MDASQALDIINSVKQPKRRPNQRSVKHLLPKRRIEFSHYWEKLVYGLLVNLGLYSGCRISELCNLKKKHVVQDSGIVVLNIEPGKTRAATRSVPLPDEIGAKAHQHAEQKKDEDYLIGLTNKAASRTFSSFKTKYVSSNKL